MARPRKSPLLLDPHSRSAHTLYVNNLLWECANGLAVERGISMSEFVEGVFKAALKNKDKYDALQQEYREAADNLISKLFQEGKDKNKVRMQELSSAEAVADRRKAEQQAAEDKAAEAEQKYREKVWRALRREIIWYYDIINGQLKEIAAKKARGDEDDYEAFAYSEIKMNLEYRKILRFQRDLSYQTFIDCFNSIDYVEEVEKPRKVAEAEREAAEA